jgi:ADP-ribose pyrophosphatase YjhB (NUDIX family)
VATVRCVGGVVHDEHGRLLLIRRGHEPARGRWTLPGGRVQPGETDAEAVIRELREETGLAVHPGALAGTAVLGDYEIFDYACTVRAGRLRAGDDADDARWIDAATFERMAGAGTLTDGLADTLRRWGVLPRR